jgi:diaminopimelate epimerase
MNAIRFSKMHGIGNDYVYIDADAERVEDPAALARAVSDRHTAIGGDGVILVSRAQAGCAADARMRIFNADGSEAQMCGNGLRCVAKFVVDRGLSTSNPLRVETGRGVLPVRWWRGADGSVSEAEVEMGAPMLSAADVGVRWPGVSDGDRLVGVRFDQAMWREAIAAHSGRVGSHAEADLSWWSASCTEPTATLVSMGNPHIVFWCRDPEKIPLERVGAAIECHAFFPQRINVHFVVVGARDHLRMRTWERGSGITLACGTGASAVLVAGVLEGRCARAADIDLPGGRLRIAWERDEGFVRMRGPATHAFDGVWGGALEMCRGG